MDTLREVTVPDIGDFSEVPVTEILVAVGDAVAIEDPLVAIESDKATMEIPAPFAGTVREIHLSVGEKVSEGTPILSLESAGEADAAPVAPLGESDSQPLSARDASPATAAQPPRSPEGDEAGSVLGESSRPEQLAVSGPPAGASTAAAEPARDWASVYAGPSVRRRARELEIDLRTVSGSGRRGRISLQDLERAPSAAPTAPATESGLEAPALLPWPSVDFAKFGEVERIPLTRIQKLSAATLTRNWLRIPHVTHNEEADITDLEAFRRELNAEQSQVKVTIVAILLKAAAAALRNAPRLNSSLEGEELVLKRYYHLGFAADTPQGLVVPVIRDVDRKGLLELAAELTELSAKARAGRLSPTEMSGGTFTISSLGGLGGTSFTPIVNAPEVAILGVVRAAIRPVWDGGQFQPRLMLPLSLSYDHRVVDGAVAARFCADLAALLGDMRRVLL